MTHSEHSPYAPFPALEDDTQDVEVLEGGNVSDQVLRIGATVRKPWLRSSPAVTSLLRYLHMRGYSGSPITYGERPRGYQRLAFVPGTLADRMPPMTTDELRELGAMVRQLHDLTADYRPAADAQWESVFPPEEPEVICHNDLAPWNLVRDPGGGPESWCLIDWDGAGPGSRMGDLGYAAHGFVPLHEGGDPEVDGLRLRALADGYGCDADQRRALPGAALRRVRGMFEVLEEGARTGQQPWARLHAEGHADHWGAAAAYITRHQEHWGEMLVDQAGRTHTNAAEIG
ncbi:phosphotransferase enzyme family protein [Nocardiopsis valliformis]|uniref:phosphotransferase enzyme family protein n=1 Tax=Nocardiopsis valliformis TaxID=239974 RepID=UPI00034D6F34|nr:aminoglycoside phosphotransferase family protein [Nocardiopsis valliformis]